MKLNVYWELLVLVMFSRARHTQNTERETMSGRVFDQSYQVSGDQVWTEFDQLGQTSDKIGHMELGTSLQSTGLY